MIRVAGAIAVSLAIVGGAFAEALKTKTAHAGPVSATVSWRAHDGVFATTVRLKISRNGRVLLERKLGFALPQSIRIRDLDANREGEVIADFYTGGAHCCLFSRIYRYTGATYVPIRHMWGDVGYKLDDLGRDGVPELVSADDHFAYAFTAYAGSAFPVQIWDYRAGRMVDVTRSYPALVHRDATSHWNEYLRQRRSDYPDSRGILAAWMADQYLLGHQARGWKILRQLRRRHEFRGLGGGDFWAKGNAYLAKLRKFLEQQGYAQ